MRALLYRPLRNIGVATGEAPESKKESRAVAGERGHGLRCNSETSLGALRFPQFDDAEVREDFFFARERFDQIEHALAHPRIGDFREGTNELETPEIPNLKMTDYIFYRQGHEFVYKQISDDEFNFFNSFSSFEIFSDAISTQSFDQVQMLAGLLFKNENLFCIE